MKKLISVLMLAIVLFNFILYNRVYADDLTFNDDVTENTITSSDLEGIISESTVKYKDTATTVDFVPFRWLFGMIAGVLTGFLNIFPKLMELVMFACIGERFTIEKAVFNEIALFNIDYFNFSDPYEYTLGDGSAAKIITSDNDVMTALRTSVAKFYYILRLIAMAISLLILIYVGIRMALSTLSTDKAKYKKMLIGWGESIVILFAMQYIISLLIGVGNIFSNLVYDLRCILDSETEISFETGTLSVIHSLTAIASGWNYALYSIVFWVLIYIQTKFFLMYFRRLITVGFLILISPLITITYPIDKIGDGKAQAFSVWLTELGMNIFIQPIHAIIYLMFMYTAGEIAKTSIWVALAFLLALTKIEKIVLRLFDLRKVTSLKPLDEQRKDS